MGIVGVGLFADWMPSQQHQSTEDKLPPQKSITNRKLSWPFSFKPTVG